MLDFSEMVPSGNSYRIRSLSAENKSIRSLNLPFREIQSELRLSFLPNIMGII